VVWGEVILGGIFVKRKLIGILVSFCLILVLIGIPLISACAAVEPTGDLVVLMPSLGSGVWGPNVGGGVDDDIKELCNELLVFKPMEDDPPEYLPMLAERWEVSEDGLTWDWYLRKGVQFHDGWGEFTAEDVKFTYELVASPGSTSGIAENFRTGEEGNLVSLEVVDDYHVRLHLKSPDVKMLHNVSSGEGGMMVSKAYYDAVGADMAIQHPIGTGPWKFVEYKPAEYIKYEAGEDHWRVTPEFKNLYLREVPELSTRIAMLKTGDADIAEIPVDNVAELEAAGLHMKVLPGGGAGNLLLGGQVLPTREGYDPTVPWVTHQDEEEAFADDEAGWGKLKPGGSDWNRRALMVRMAMTYAINRQAIIDGIFYGEGEPSVIGGGGGWGAYGSVWARPEWEPYPYDPELARQLLIDAGYPNGFELTIVIHQSDKQPRLQEISEAIARDYEAIGLTVERWMTEYIVQRPIWGARESAWQIKVDAYGPYPEPWMSTSYCLNTKNEAYNDGFESLEHDALMEAAENTIDYDERVQATLAHGDYYRDRYIHVPVVLTNRVWALSERVEDCPTSLGPFRYTMHLYEYATRAD
jgi:peptide/nickel transport system substrate-binding protein